MGKSLTEACPRTLTRLRTLVNVTRAPVLDPRIMRVNYVLRECPSFARAWTEEPRTTIVSATITCSFPSSATGFLRVWVARSLPPICGSFKPLQCVKLGVPESDPPQLHSEVSI